MVNPKGAKSLFDLMFLHNTSADKLARIEQMGGMPMPSIAVTQKDIPFEDYGDITLIGRKQSFDPSRKDNPFWNADAYTVRAPSPLQMTKKGAGKRFDDAYSPYKDYGYLDSARNSIWDLESKRGLSESEYSNAINFFESNGSALAKFADDMGILPEGADVYKLRELRDQNRFAFDKWMKDEVSEYFQPDQYFISKPSRPTDTGRTSAVLKPYTADEVSKYMKKSKGAAQESSMTIGGTGANRAAVADRLKSFDDMRSSKDMLAPRGEDLTVSHETLSMMQQDLAEALRPYYKYSADGWRYMDEAGGMMLESSKKGLNRALDEYGFENVPDSLKAEIRDWQNQLRTAPTQYFEGKPERAVSLNEFAGAIAPQDTPQGIIDMLTKHGVDVQRYTDDAERTALRSKFQSEMFTNPASLLGGLGVAGAAGYSALKPNTAQANPIDQLRASEQQFGMSPVEQLRASEREFMAPNAVSDAYGRANEFFDKERQAAQESGATLGEWLIPDYEYSQKRAMGDKSVTTGLLSMLEKLDPVGYIGLINAIGRR